MIKELEVLETIGENYSMCLEDVNHNEFVYVLKNSDEYALLEKAIKRNDPMKSLYISGMHICNNCGIDLNITYKHNVIKYTPNYCFNCGQKLDWRTR